MGQTSLTGYRQRTVVDFKGDSAARRFANHGFLIDQVFRIAGMDDHIHKRILHHGQHHLGILRHRAVGGTYRMQADRDNVEFCQSGVIEVESADAVHRIGFNSF